MANELGMLLQLLLRLLRQHIYLQRLQSNRLNYTLLWACTLAKGKTANIYTDSLVYMLLE